MKNLSQKTFVENELIKNRRITRNFCLRNYISRLGAIISVLKDNGYVFEAKYVEIETPFGKGKDFEYSVVKFPRAIQEEINLKKEGF